MKNKLKQILLSIIQQNGTKYLTTILSTKPRILNYINQNTSFVPQSYPPAARYYCFIHDIKQHPVCKTCGKLVEWNRLFEKGFKIYCSTSCKNKDPEQQSKNRQGFLKKYNTINPSLVPEIREKIKQTNLKKYGAETPLKNEQIKQKIKNTNIEKYGTEFPIQNPLIFQKVVETNKQRYGVDFVQQNQQIKQITRQNNLKKYSREHYLQTHISLDSLIKLNDKQWLYQQHITEQKSLLQIAKDLNVNDTTVGRYLMKHGLLTHHFFNSQGEQEIKRFLLQNEINFVSNARNIIPPYELDIYIPEYNLAIEYCGLYWHSEQAGKDKNYHRNKYVLCKENSINLLTIFEDEWKQKRQIVENLILYKLQKTNQNKINARQCDIKYVDSKTKKDFFESTHIQGDGPGSVNIGLFYKNELVACMSFIKANKNNFILNRYSTVGIIRGGFSKLFNYAKQNLDFKQIITFADLRVHSGEIYLNNGFVFDKTIPPDYYYVINNTRYHKFGFRRKYLQKKLNFFDPLLSEKQNCDNNGLLRIWDCGKNRYIFNS